MLKSPVAAGKRRFIPLGMRPAAAQGNTRSSGVVEHKITPLFDHDSFRLGDDPFQERETLNQMVERSFSGLRPCAVAPESGLPYHFRYEGNVGTVRYAAGWLFPVAASQHRLCEHLRRGST